MPGKNHDWLSEFTEQRHWDEASNEEANRLVDQLPLGERAVWELFGCFCSEAFLKPVLLLPCSAESYMSVCKRVPQNGLGPWPELPASSVREFLDLHENPDAYRENLAHHFTKWSEPDRQQGIAESFNCLRPSFISTILEPPDSDVFGLAKIVSEERFETNFRRREGVSSRDGLRSIRDAAEFTGVAVGVLPMEPHKFAIFQRDASIDHLVADWSQERAEGAKIVVFGSGGWNVL